MQSNEELWKEYYSKILSSPHRVQTEVAETLNFSGNYTAIDCGCGTGNDINFLALKGYHVHGFDIHDKALEICNERFIGNSRITITKNSFNEFNYPKSGLVIANLSLFFCDPSEFSVAWSKIDASISSNGVFCGDFIGHNDSWVKSDEHTVAPLTNNEVYDLFNGYEIETITERDSEGLTALGKMKHWHTYQVIAKKSIQ